MELNQAIETIIKYNYDHNNTILRIVKSIPSIRPIRVAAKMPNDNQTVWFWSSGKERSISFPTGSNVTGWHLGWHSGSRWHSYFNEDIAEDDSNVRAWFPVKLPDIPGGAKSPA